jgi:hypothetical protein
MEDVLDSRWSLSSGEPKARPEGGNERDLEFAPVHSSSAARAQADEGGER